MQNLYFLVLGYNADKHQKILNIKDVTSCYAAVGLFCHQLLQDNANMKFRSWQVKCFQLKLILSIM